MSPEEFDRDWNALVAAGRFVQARAVARTIGADAMDTAAVEILAEIQELAREKSWARALRRIDRLQELAAPVDIEALAAELHVLRDASAELDRRNADEAIEALNTLDDPYLVGEEATQRGTARILQDDVEGAREAFERAVEHDPRHHRAITNLGNLALEAGDVDAAIAAYERALTIDDDFANAHHNLGVALRKKGHVARSVRSLRRAQRAMQREQTERARGAAKGAAGGKWMRWIWFAAAGILLYLVLSQSGVI